MKKIMLLFMLLLILMPSAFARSRFSITPGSLLWRAELIFERVQERFNPASKIIHAKERQQELIIATNTGQAKAVENIQRVMAKKKIKINEVTQQKIKKRFEITDAKLERIKNILNQRGTKLNDKLKNKGLMIMDGKFAIQVLTFDSSTIYFDVVVEDATIKTITQVSDHNNLEGYAAIMTITQAEALGLHHLTWGKIIKYGKRVVIL